MPVKRPDILDRNCIGEHRAVSIKLKLITQRDDAERDRPAKPDRDHEAAQRARAVWPEDDGLQSHRSAALTMQEWRRNIRGDNT